MSNTYRCPEPVEVEREYEAETNLAGFTVRGRAPSAEVFRERCAAALSAKVIWLTGPVREIV